MSLSDRIIKNRDIKGITQAEMARLLDMVQSNYARLEKRDSKLTLEQIESIATALGVTVAELLGIEESGQERIVELENENARLKSKIKGVEDARAEISSIKKQLQVYDELFKEKTQRSRELREWAKSTIQKVEAGDEDAIENLVSLIKDLYLSPNQ